MTKKNYLNSKELTPPRREFFNRGKALSKQITKTREKLELLREQKRLVTFPLIRFMDTHELDGVRQGKTLAYLTHSTTAPSFNVVMSQVGNKLPKKYQSMLKNTYDYLFSVGTPYLAYKTNGKEKK